MKGEKRPFSKTKKQIEVINLMTKFVEVLLRGG